MTRRKDVILFIAGGFMILAVIVNHALKSNQKADLLIPLEDAEIQAEQLPGKELVKLIDIYARDLEAKRSEIGEQLKKLHGIPHSRQDSTEARTLQLELKRMRKQQQQLMIRYEIYTMNCAKRRVGS